jgi:hypothetical protein
MHTRPARVTSGTMRTWADVGKEKGDSPQRHEAGLETRQMGTRLWNVPLSQRKFPGVQHFSDCFKICSLSRRTLIFLKVRTGVQTKFLNSFALCLRGENLFQRRLARLSAGAIQRASFSISASGPCSSYASTLKLYRAAVSVRNTIGPRLIGMHPALRADDASAGVKSPSGPIKINADLGRLPWCSRKSFSVPLKLRVSPCKEAISGSS